MPRRRARSALCAVPLAVLTALGFAALPASAITHTSPVTCGEGATPAARGARPATTGDEHCAAIAGFRVPMFLLPLFRTAERTYRVPCTVLAAITEIETDFGRNAAVSPAGAVGWMQFMPATWRALGADADGDGRRDPWDRADAILAAAAYLRAAGADTDPRRALLAYNHADWYVADVLAPRRLAAAPDDVIAALTRAWPAPAFRCRRRCATARSACRVSGSTSSPNGGLRCSPSPTLVWSRGVRAERRLRGPARRRGQLLRVPGLTRLAKRFDRAGAPRSRVRSDDGAPRPGSSRIHFADMPGTRAASHRGARIRSRCERLDGARQHARVGRRPIAPRAHAETVAYVRGMRASAPGPARRPGLVQPSSFRLPSETPQDSRVRRVAEGAGWARARRALRASGRRDR
jgi:Transglycosylase SLT domain